MKPAAFEYFAPESVEKAVDRLNAHKDEAKVLAGGQSLVPLMNMRLARPAVIVDINKIRALDYMVRAAVEPDGDIHASAEYRRHVSGVLVQRALREALTRVREAA